MLTWHLKITCCWWANVCFIRTILMLCSIAYFFALFTVSCCSDEIFGRPAPNIPGSVRYLAPGPIEWWNAKVRLILEKIPSNKNYLFLSDLISKMSIKNLCQCSILLKLDWLRIYNVTYIIWYIISKPF